MDVKKVLAANLRKLMDAHPELNSLPLMEKATKLKGCKVGKSTIDRVLHADTPFNLDALQAVAKVFGLDAWQMLVPNIAPSNPPVLRSIGAVEDQFYARARELAKHLAALPDTETK